MHCAPGTVLGECPMCATSYWLSTCHMPGPGLVSIHCAPGSVMAATDKKCLNTSVKA